MLGDLDAINQQRHQIERVERAASWAAVFATNRRLTALLLVLRVRTFAAVGSRLRA
jgi:hypothetical protein